MTRPDATAARASHARRDPDALRSDAQHNRVRILTVAREALAESSDASLNSIAKKAGVGPGTLYRHFPSREALVLAVYEDDVRMLTISAAELLVQHEPLSAFRLWFDRLATCAMTNQSLAGALQSATTAGTADGIYAPITSSAANLLSACRQAGSIRPDVETDDLLLLLGFLGRVEPGPDASTRVTRLLDLIMAGLQAGSPRSMSQARKARTRRSLRLRRRLSLVSFSAPRSL